MNAVCDAPVLTPTVEPPKPKRQPPYAVIVYNDDYHTFEYVIEMLRKVFGYPFERGQKLAMEIHTQGQALVWSGALEVAELKVDQIKSVGPDLYASSPVSWPLRCAIEPLA